MGNHRGNEAVSAAVESAKAVVFDFDGTLVDSNEIKWSGFEHVFSEFKERLPEISAYCRGNNHTIRGEKFRVVCEQIFTVSTLRSGAVVTRALCGVYHQCGCAHRIPGAAEFIRKVGDRPTALLSSTPHGFCWRFWIARAGGRCLARFRERRW
jgi:beta-phosphoglucomutase-like phosphatase (HAD superfamily)